MRYVRTFILQSCHFNGSAEYDLYWKKGEISYFDCLTLMKGTHGHNFKIEVEVTLAHGIASMRPSDGWLIDDVALESVVREWDNTNLSVHKDFSGIRATTENMALLLHAKLNKAFKDCDFIVRVFERDEIYAEVYRSDT